MEFHRKSKATSIGREIDLALLKKIPEIKVYDYKRIRSADSLDHNVIFHKATYNDLSG